MNDPFIDNGTEIKSLDFFVCCYHEAPATTTRFYQDVPKLYNEENKNNNCFEEKV